VGSVVEEEGVDVERSRDARVTEDAADRGAAAALREHRQPHGPQIESDAFLVRNDRGYVVLGIAGFSLPIEQPR
jgi:hypothetical protein